MNIYRIAGSFGTNASSRIKETTEPGISGALACLESFYYAFNHRDIGVLSRLWLDQPQVQLNNPLGGMVSGKPAITRLYEKIFTGPADVWVTFTHIAVFETTTVITFAGEEIGEFRQSGTQLSLRIRTTRILSYDEQACCWGLVHHHGSIDDPILLAQYQSAINRFK